MKKRVCGIHEEIHLLPYAIQAFLWIFMAENRNCVATSLSKSTKCALLWISVAENWNCTVILNGMSNFRKVFKNLWSTGRNLLTTLCKLGFIMDWCGWKSAQLLMVEVRMLKFKAICEILYGTYDERSIYDPTQNRLNYIYIYMCAWAAELQESF
jgi:hypothetical protein